MAIIGTIRKNGWILIVMMVLALGGFILMDFLGNQQRYNTADLNTMGKVNGVQIKRDEFDNYEKQVASGQNKNTLQVRTQIWNYFVERALVQQEAEAIGLGVSKDELRDLEFGNNPSSIIRERFNDPNTLQQIKTAIDAGQFTDPQYRAFWAEQEKEITKKRLEDKLMGMVTKGLYTPKWQAEMAFLENNSRLEALYVRVPYDKINDKEVELTDADYSAFLKKHPGVYDQKEETRVISYVNFQVIPTSSDSAEALNGINKLLSGLKAADNDSAYAVANNGVYDSNYRTKTSLPPTIADSMLKMPLKSIIGPVLDNGTYVVAKILDRKTLPDSVRARHILIQGATPASEKIIDSLMNLVNTGKARFDSLAVKNSQDPSSGIKGGDLGWFAEGKMVAEFNDVCFNKGEQGKIYKVSTQFGWHMIEITGKKFIKNEGAVKALFLSQRVEPSPQTQDAVKDRAQNMAQHAKTLQDLESMAGQENLTVQPTAPLKPNDYNLGALGATESARAVIRWAFDEKTKEGTVSKEFFTFRDPSGGYFDANYVVAAVSAISPAGDATVASLKANPKAVTEVRNAKKAEQIKAKLQGASSLDAAASAYGVAVDSLHNATMLQAFLPNGGAEPAVIGSLFALKNGSTSKPVAGNTGVYMIMPITDLNAPAAPADMTMFRRQVTSSAVSAVRVSLLSEMKKKAEVKDNRSRFY